MALVRIPTAPFQNSGHVSLVLRMNRRSSDRKSQSNGGTLTASKPLGVNHGQAHHAGAEEAVEFGVCAAWRPLSDRGQGARALRQGTRVATAERGPLECSG